MKGGQVAKYNFAVMYSSNHMSYYFSIIPTGSFNLTMTNSLLGHCWLAILVGEPTLFSIRKIYPRTSWGRLLHYLIWDLCVPLLG